jgi:hypothetical protein
MLEGMVMDLWRGFKDLLDIAVDFPWWVWLTLVGLVFLMWIFMKK